jgi:HSP20 family protein
VTADVPGVKSDDVVVELHEGVLTVRGEKRSEHEEKDSKRRWLERSYGTFSRSFSLPRDADPDQVDASFKDGVLTVRISKAAEAKPQTIAIKG